MKSDFMIAVHALTYLAYCNRCVASDELSKTICTNAVRIRKVMSTLKEGEIITTREGKHGGYMLHRNADEIMLSHVAELLDISFITLNWYSGSDKIPCIIANEMPMAMNAYIADMEALCMQYLSNISIQNVLQQLMKQHHE